MGRQDAYPTVRIVHSQQINVNHSTTVKSIQDIMRKDAGMDGDAQRISQLVWMIFEDRETEYELLEDDY